MQTIVIAGGGAGGLELATRLGDTLGKSGRARIILVDRSPAHFWKPLLHTVASGKLDPQAHQIDYSAQAAEHGFHFVCGEVEGVDRARAVLQVGPRRAADGSEMQPARAIPYDRLVLAFGAVTNFYGTAGAADHALTLDHVQDAERFRQRFIAACMQASSRPAYTAVNIVIIGGGATGVELAAELSHAVRELARYRVHSLDPDSDVRVRLVERGDRLLPQLNPRLSRRAARHLRSLGVEVCTGSSVARVEADAVHDSDGNCYPSDITLWAAGVEAPRICVRLGLSLNRIRQVVVTPSLQTIDDPRIFALGDCSSHVCPVKGAALPPRAQVAHQQAMFLADLLARERPGELPHFRYRDYGSLVSLGPFAAVGSLAAATGREVLVGGWMARVLYRLMYRKHVLALHGFARMAVQTLAHWIGDKVTPPVRLH
ncbi:NAD(P)/FAD-dependent oxidoreductase [Noviherbaspirillum aridicola]|uniref:NADH dehydrogenase n=1 Tax=Noviherbaspirillum aridicola TaxID=2849687 RepID=A0ABQ4Q3L0_9BURK|nr:NAD(P)/FAD-dependent oxidoreductase [Noviherbaspirillum aridicola]GIZ51440.1 NADH dehydrogenase [Noviherbaspirillum aridicola]